ncbi:3-hydroxybutyryl-CoA dehydrogenase [Pseudonocardia alni]|uniref:3-hydroxybutyryl-CoA dehydrogenase n=1 Tax=Pseudonocardia alni TaxID=33907 RepID=UPI0033E1DF23
MGGSMLLGVVGAGQMGSGIAEVAARADVDVTVVDVQTAAVEAGRRNVERSLTAAVHRGRIDDEAAARAQGRIRWSTAMDALTHCTVVIEAVAEIESIKVEVFRELDGVVKDQEALLASNTSSIPIATLAAATNRPGHVVGTHFFNPVPAMGLVELVPSLLTLDRVQEAAEHFLGEVLGKTVVRSHDRSGFVVNALLVPYLLGAIRMYESGFASAADIDTGMRLGCGHPMGPLALCDLIGLDTIAAVAESLYDEFREAHYAPPPILRRMVASGRLGRKTGHGFHRHDA